jgi:hypothetical protein
VRRIHHWPEGRGLLGELVAGPAVADRRGRVPACPGPAAGVFGWAKGYATVAYNAATGARLWATHYRNKQH